MSKGSGRAAKSHVAESSPRTPSGKAAPQRAAVAKAAAARGSQVSSAAAQDPQRQAPEAVSRGPEQVASAGDDQRLAQRPPRQPVAPYPKAAPAQPRPTASNTGPLGPSPDAALRPRPKAAPDHQAEPGLLQYEASVPQQAPSLHLPPPSVASLRRSSFIDESETALVRHREPFSRQISGSPRQSRSSSLQTEPELPKAKSAARKRPKAKKRALGTAQPTKPQAFSFSTDGRKTRRPVRGSTGPGDVSEASRVKTLGAKARPKYAAVVSSPKQPTSLSLPAELPGSPPDSAGRRGSGALSEHADGTLLVAVLSGAPTSDSNATAVTQPARGSPGTTQTSSYNADVSPNSSKAQSSGSNAAATASTTYANPSVSLGTAQVSRCNATVSSSPGDAHCSSSNGTFAASSSVSASGTSSRFARQARIDAEGEPSSPPVQLSVLSAAQVGGSSSSCTSGLPVDFRSPGGNARLTPRQPVAKCAASNQSASPRRMVIRSRLSNNSLKCPGGEGSDDRERHVSFGTERNVEVVRFNVEEPAPCTTRVARRVFGGDLQASAASSRRSTIPLGFGGGGPVGQLNVVTNTVATGVVAGRAQAPSTVPSGLSARPGIRDLNGIDFEPGLAFL